MVKITWDQSKQRPVIHCYECGRPIVTHRGASIGFGCVGMAGRRVVIVHNGCKSQRWEWFGVDDFFWLLADELGVMRKAIQAVRRKPKRKKTRRYRRGKNKSLLERGKP